MANFIATEKAEAIRVEAISVRPNIKKSQTTFFSVEHCTVTKLNHDKEIGQWIATSRQNGLFLVILHVQGMQSHTKPLIGTNQMGIKAT